MEGSLSFVVIANVGTPSWDFFPGFYEVNSNNRRICFKGSIWTICFKKCACVGTSRERVKRKREHVV